MPDQVYKSLSYSSLKAFPHFQVRPVCCLGINVISVAVAGETRGARRSERVRPAGRGGSPNTETSFTGNIQSYRCCPTQSALGKYFLKIENLKKMPKKSLQAIFHSL